MMLSSSTHRTNTVLRRAAFACVAVAMASIVFATTSANALPVWNVNVGNIGGSNIIAPGDDYQGVAVTNTVNSTWNNVTSAGTTALVDSTGDGSAGVTITLTAAGGSSLNISVQNLNSGDKIFNTWIKDNGNNDAFDITFGNLIPSGQYDLIIYSDWWWKNGDSGQTISQTAGTGLAGSFALNRYIGGDVPFGTVTSLAQDTDPANVVSQTNYARFRFLTPDGSDNLTFSMGGVNGPINGFQLVQVPEPNTFLLTSLGLLGLAGLTRLRRRK